MASDNDNDIREGDNDKQKKINPSNVTNTVDQRPDEKHSDLDQEHQQKDTDDFDLSTKPKATDDNVSDGATEQHSIEKVEAVETKDGRRVHNDDIINKDESEESISIKTISNKEAITSIQPSEKPSPSTCIGQSNQNSEEGPSSLPPSSLSSSQFSLNEDVIRLHKLCEQLISTECIELASNVCVLDKGSTSQNTDSILKLLVTDDLSSIRSPEALRVYFLKYLHLLPPRVNSEILSVLIAIVKKSVFHLESARGLLFACINYITSDQKQAQTENDKRLEPSASTLSLTKHFSREWVNLLVKHSCDVEELKSILKFSERDPSLLKFIQQANIEQRNRPHAFFAFPGTKGSMMSLSPFQKWPTNLGWSFSTWFFLEPKACAQPYLYNFKTGKSGLGYSAHFTGNCLVLTSIRVKGKGVQHCVAYEFPSYKWIHCAITYHNKWRSSEIKVYVNGQLKANIDMPWQVQTTELFDKCSIGGSALINRNDRSGDLNSFCGQMSALYLFNEGLSATQICALHRLGPSYMGQFKYSNEGHVNLPPQICKTLYEERLASCLFCLFTPAAVDSGTLCIQLAPFKSSTSASAQNYFVSAPHAALLGQTKAIITQPICFTLQSLGCSRSLLPLLDAYAQRADAEACASLIGFLCDLLESSPHWFTNEIVQNNGFVLVACSLATNARQLLSDKLLDIFLNLTRTLLSTSSTASDSQLLKHFMDNILFNPSLWVYAETKVQIKLYSYLANELLHGTRPSLNRYTLGSSSSGSAQQSQASQQQQSAQSTSVVLDDELAVSRYANNDQASQSSIVADLLFSEIRRVSTVLQSLHALKYYYWIVEEKAINHKSKNYKLRPGKNELIIIRSHILAFTRELILRANITPLDETQGLLNYLSSCSQEENLIDALDTMSSLILEHPIPMVAALEQKHGVKVLLTLIGASSELVRIKSIRLLSLFLSQCSYKKKQDLMGPYNLFMLLCDRLRACRPMTLALYEALIDLMIEENHPERRVDNPDRFKEISKMSIVNSTVIKVIASLIHEEKTQKTRGAAYQQLSVDGEQQHCATKTTSLACYDTRRLFISDLWNLIVNSRDNRRIILQMSVWQHWLINLIVSTIDDSPLVRDQVLAIFRVLLYHAIRYEYGGWRVWIDTLAIIHSKQSFDEFCLQIKREQQHAEEPAQQQSTTHLKRNNSSKITTDTKQQDSALSTIASENTSPNKQEAVVSSISERILCESRGIEMDVNDNEQEEEEEKEKEEKTGGKDEKESTVSGDVTSHNDDQSSDVNGTTAVDKITHCMDSIDLAPSRAYRKTSVTELEEANLVGEGQQQQESQNAAQNHLDGQQSFQSIPLNDTTISPANETADLDDSELIEGSKNDIDSPLTNEYQSASVDETKSGGPSESLHRSASDMNKTSAAQASPAFRIPEFRWGTILVKLLNDLLFSVECDLYHWRSMAAMTSLDVPPFAPKSSFNAQASGSSGGATITAGGANSQSSVATHLLQIEAILQKGENQIYIVNVIHLVSQLADNVIIAAGGLLPLLADATGGSRASSNTGSTSTTSDKESRLAANTVICDGLTLVQANSLLYRLASMVDMVIFASTHVNLGELEADKNTTCGGILRQCLRLACTVTVKNCLILRSLQSKLSQLSELDSLKMEFPKEMFDSYHGCSLLSANGLFEQSALTLEHTDLIANLEYSPHQIPNTSSIPSLLPFQTMPIRDPNKLLQPIDISRIQACIYLTGNADSRQSQFLALSSLYFISVLMVSKYRDIIEPKQKPTKKSDSPTPSKSNSSPEPTTQRPLNSSGSPAISSVESNLLTFGKMQPNSSGTTITLSGSTSGGGLGGGGGGVNSANSLTNLLTSKLENTLDSVCPLLKSIMCDFSQFLSRTLLGSHGQDLVNKEAERTFRRTNTSPVELVMLLCSQEWQNTLQKNAGLAFIELINEGRVLSHGMKDHIVRVAMEAEFILSRLRADDVAKHEHFGLACSETLAARLHEEVLINSLISSAARRDYVLYCKFKESLANEWLHNYKLDIWEDDDRRKRRFVFDSWPNSSQLFYSTTSSVATASALEATAAAGKSSSIGNCNEEGAATSNEACSSSSAASNNEEDPSSRRILDLHKTIELGGALDSHNYSSATRQGELMAGSSDYDAIDEDDDEMEEEDDDEADDDEDVENHDDSNSPHSDSVAEQTATAASASTSGDQKRLAMKKAPYARNSLVGKPRQVLSLKNQMVASNGPASSSGGGVSADVTGSNHVGPAEHDKQQHQQQQYDQQQAGAQQWEYEDYGSVNDFTGSVIFAAEASLVWSIYAVPGLLQITTNELYFEPNQNIAESIDSLKREQQQQQQDSVSMGGAQRATLAGKSDTSTTTDTTNTGPTNTTSTSTMDSAAASAQLRKIDLMALRYCDFLTASNGKIQLADIRAIFSRHYLLQPNALEIFIAQRTSVMFAFNDFDIVKRVVKYLPPFGVGIKYGISQSRRASLMSPRQLFAASNMTQRWQRREIGNFQYLMFLNTIAGRTYQDLNQYPVFPWILTNYESDELDLALPTNFRDLSKPVGALNSKRRDEFIERYQSWDNAKVPAFHYGTHYSTAAFVLNWLSRLRGAFNSAYLALQDGKYEEDSRLFVSLGDSWVSSLVGGQQNVKELIPEFFYLPEMFHSNLGLPEVELPPWAKKSAEQFVRMHRIALESELVSCQLHQWIDLIFGYKQRGPEAINSVNTFYYLTYQGNVNLNMIKDPSLRDAIETQIKHFGQTPSQLTTEPHPPRFSALHSAPMAFSTSVDELNRVVKFPFNHSIVHISSCINNYIAAAVAGGASAADSPTTGTVQQRQATSGSSTSGSTSGNSGGSAAVAAHVGPSSVLTITSNNQYQIHKWQANEQTGHPFSLDPQLEGAPALAAAYRRQLIDVDDLCSNIYLKLSSSCDGADDVLQEPGTRVGRIAPMAVSSVAGDTVDEVQWPCAHHIVTLNGKYIIMGSFYDNSFRVFTTDSGKLCQVIYGHRAPITCLARSEGNAVADFYIATGSQDCSLLIWFWNERYAQVEGSGVSAVHNPLPKLSITGHQTAVLSALISAELGLIISGSKNLILVNTTTTGESLLQISVNLSRIFERTLQESAQLSLGATNGGLGGNSADTMRRPQVKDKQRTILEASMLGDPKDQQRALKQQQHLESSSGSIGLASTLLSAKEERIAQLSEIYSSNDYYVTNLQLARELAFIVCIALPAPRKRSSSGASGSGSSPPALLLTFNLKGSLMDSATIGLAAASSRPRLGDACLMTISRDGEHIILNDSPSTLKIYKTFGLQPVYAYNINDIHTSGGASENTTVVDNAKIRSLALLDHRFVLVGLDNGKLVIYNCDFKNLQ